MDRERVVGKRRAVVRRGRKHTRATFKQKRERGENIFELYCSIFRVSCETLKYFCPRERPFLFFLIKKLLEREKRHHKIMLARKTTASLTTIVGRRVRFTPLSRALYRSRFLIHIKKESFFPFGENWGNDREIFPLSFSLSLVSRASETREMTSLETLTLEKKGERKSSIERDSRSSVLSHRFLNKCARSPIFFCLFLYLFLSFGEGDLS